MGTVHHSFLFLLLAIILSAAIANAQSQRSVRIPIRKDSKSLQYYTALQMGSNRASVKAVIDLGFNYLWFDCDNYISNTYAPIPCGSRKCELAKGQGCIVGCNSLPPPVCTNNTCGSFNLNPFQGVSVSGGFLEDTLTATTGARVPHFIFSCMSHKYTQGLAPGITGLVGLARTDISLHKQVTRLLDLPHKFSLCLPMSTGLGKLLIGDVPSRSISHLLKTTPLIVNPAGTTSGKQGEPSIEYFIDVRSIKVNGATVESKDSYFSIDERTGNGGTKLSTIQNYTSLLPSINRPLTRAFAKAASDMSIKSAAAVAPFRACFSSSSIARTPSGPKVPTIDLVLPGTDTDVYWRINGANSMVEVDEETMCLGFVDAEPRRRGSLWPRTSIIIGTHQLEENYLTFDFVSSQFQFISSLSSHGISCSHL